MENLEPGVTNAIYRSPGDTRPVPGCCGPDMQVANNVANFWISVILNVVLKNVDTFTIFDTMESMKGHTKHGTVN